MFYNPVNLKLDKSFFCQILQSIICLFIIFRYRKVLPEPISFRVLKTFFPEIAQSNISDKNVFATLKDMV